MAQLTAQVVSYDDEFKRQVARLLRACGVPVGIVEGRTPRAPAPTSWSSTSAPTPPRGWRRSSGCARAAPSLAIFAIAAAAEPDLILQAMRAGANEFFPWNTTDGSAGGARDRGIVPRRGAADRGAARGGLGERQAALRDARVSRRQGRRRHDDRRGQLRRRAGATDQAADDRRRPEGCLGEVALFLGVRPALHRARRDREPAPARQGLPEGAGRQAQVRPRHPRRLRAVRPAQRAGRRRDRGAAARARPAPTTTWSSTPATSINPCVAAALYAADTIFLVTNPDVPSIRNAQRLVDRVRQLGAGSERDQGPAQSRLRPAPDCAQADRDGARLRHPSHLLERLPDRLDGAQLGRAAGADQPLRDRRRSSTASRATSSALPTKSSPSRRRSASSWASSKGTPR